MKLRIINKNGKFYCQYKRCGSWWHFLEGYSECYVERPTLEEAEKWINSYIDCYQTQSKPPVIVREYTI